MPSWQTLAPELIFEFLQYFRPELISVLNPGDFPWHLGHICKSWRAVFVSSSQFWNTLLIDLDSKANAPRLDPRPYEHAVDIVKVCISRSKSRPLKLAYWMTLPALYSSKYRTRISQYCRCILDVLIAESARWQDIDFSLGLPQLAKLHSARNCFPLLESVRLFLHPQSWDGKKLRKHQASLFTNAPKLKRTYLMEHGAWRVNWSSLTTIHLCDLELLPEIVATLRQTERLEELIIFGVHDDIPCDTIPVKLPYLKLLHCGTVDLLLLFVAPGLEELSIRHEFEISSEIEPALREFFESLHHLRRLRLYTDFPEVIQMVLQHVPVMQELFLFGFDMDKQLIELSKFQRARDLEAITLGFRYPHECARQEFIETVKLWKKQDGAATGIGPFENLVSFTMELFNVRNSSYHLARPISRLKNHLEDQKIRYVVRDVSQLSKYRVRRPFFGNGGTGDHGRSLL